MPVEYKPCPFCGSKNIEYNNDTGPGDEGFWEWIECVDCGAKCPDKETWNRRANTMEGDSQLFPDMVHSLLETKFIKLMQKTGTTG